MIKVSRWLALLLLLIVPTACAVAGGEVTPSPVEPTTAATTTAPAGGEVQEVLLQNFQFSPAQVTIQAGTTVRWVNRDNTPHTVTAGTREAPTGLFDSGNFIQGETFTFTFEEPGTYPYFCALHPNMDGEIIVQ